MKSNLFSNLLRKCLSVAGKGNIQRDKTLWHSWISFTAGSDCLIHNRCNLARYKCPTILFSVFPAHGVLLLKWIPHSKINVALSVLFFSFSWSQVWPLLLPLCLCPTAHDKRRAEKTERSHQLHLSQGETPQIHMVCFCFSLKWSPHGLERIHFYPLCVFVVSVSIWSWSVTMNFFFT